MLERELCVRELCVLERELCVRELCVRELCVLERELCVCARVCEKLQEKVSPEMECGLDTEALLLSVGTVTEIRTGITTGIRTGIRTGVEINICGVLLPGPRSAMRTRTPAPPEEIL